MLKCQSSNINDYLAETEEIDFSHLVIRELLEKLYDVGMEEVEIVKRAFEFVRDEINHSWDIQSTRITRRASEVLIYREGICYAKSHILAALLRPKGIPTGFCYQKITLGDTPDTGFVIHALNAVYLAKYSKWIRLDARGNKEGVDAQFGIDNEQLAFPIRQEYGEIDYPVIHKCPNLKTVSVFKAFDNCVVMYSEGLPDSL